MFLLVKLSLYFNFNTHRFLLSCIDARSQPVELQCTYYYFYVLWMTVTVVEYKIADMGFLRFYLAPKIEDQDAEWCQTAEADYIKIHTAATAVIQVDMGSCTWWAINLGERKLFCHNLGYVEQCIPFPQIFLTVMRNTAAKLHIHVLWQSQNKTFCTIFRLVCIVTLYV